jgi:hypothetical protein
MPCDANFNVNERLKKKTVSVFSPDGYCSHIQKAVLKNVLK